jgi:Fe2+ or Zn2+ uptake regulation protein
MQVPDELFEPLANDVQAQYGFQLRRNHFAVLGTCRQCMSPSSPSTSGQVDRYPNA